MRSQKQNILNIIRTAEEHLTAEQVHEHARRQRPGMAMGTVYRNLALLAAEGEIGRVEVPGQPVRYDRSTKPHGHMICLRCGRTKDLELEEDLLSYLRERTGADVRSYQLSVRYLCSDCAGKP